MLAVHAFWSRSRGLCLWAEDAGRTVKSPSQALRTARPHPFAASSDALGEIHPGKPATATLLLPSLRTAPLDSPELIRITPRPVPTAAPMLLPWSVPVVSFDPAATLAVLGDRTDAVRYGASVQFLAEVAAFARELVIRGRVLPALDHTPQGSFARWRAVLQGPDVVAMHALVTAMPPVCRAESDVAVDTGGQGPSELVSDALRALVDAAMRERLAEGQAGSLLDLRPPRRGRHPKRPSAAQAWLAALSSPDGRFDAELDDIDELERVLSIWRDFGAGQGGPARATFRLSEAGASDEAADSAEADTTGGGYWRLEFLLQSVNDPSLLVPAEQTWNAGGTLRRWLDRPQELLLTELGRPAGSTRSWSRRCGKPVRSRSSWTLTAPTTSCRRSRGHWTRPASACCCRPGGTAAASSGSSCRPTHRSTAW